ncbi:flagellar biosynthesis protein FlgN [Gordoniibacillus kamchatkensis]|uniref:Flagellar biosynthesis protein FlgN n=1 Tax=Gordoniibacillus kamchatkensis TaxID=1590651 RepID=A0ABR5AIP4_9BACL|nr:flagellar biosynthesis protein FlgN [Paenibacillus sp. VKM B-2647]
MTIEPLLELMERLAAVHSQLIELANEKTPVLVRNDVDSLNAIIHRENKLVRQVAELDRERVQRTGEYLISRGYNPDPRVTVSDLIKIIFKADEKKALMNVQQILLEKLIELKRLNETNQKLIEQSLAFINFSIDLLVDDPNQDLFYKAPASSSHNAVRNGLFDTKA